MKIHNRHYRSIWRKSEEPGIWQVLDQRRLPFEVAAVDLETVQDFEWAIRDMVVRGAPLIGATAAYGVCAAIREAQDDRDFDGKLAWYVERLRATRPTAVDLFKAVDRVLEGVKSLPDYEKWIAAVRIADALVEESAAQCRAIGETGLPLIREINRKKGGEPVNILTHCNAGWLACIDYGTATAPIYLAHDAGIPVHVWVDETRPRNQGAGLTAFELGQHGVPHTVITDNAGGLLMQKGLVDLAIVGTDRTTREGDVANKIGTYLKALAAFDNEVPFYVAAPSTSIDWEIRDGLAEISIEERSEDEVRFVVGLDGTAIRRVEIMPADSPALNYGFDITPAKLVTGLITERGICAASEDGLLSLYPEMAADAIV